MKSVILCAFAANVASKEVNDGKCPMQPGEIMSKVRNDLDHHKI